MSKAAFLGTGLLGSAMVERMRAAGTEVAVWNRTESKARALERCGARVASTPEAAVEGADHVHIVLADDHAVDTIVNRVVGTIGADAVVVDHSTIAPARVPERAARLGGQGVRFLHAPVFMSPPMARAGKGLMMVAGPHGHFEAVKSILEGMTGEVWYVGDRLDLAAAYKLFGNAMLFTIITGLADVLAMARGLNIDGLDAIKLFEKFQPGVAIPMRAEKMARAEFSAMFELVMARKDVGLMLEAAGREGLALLPAIAKRMDEAIERGHGRDDVSAVATVHG